MSCGYSLTQPTNANDLTLLPVDFLWESDTKGVDESTIRNETQRGIITEYELFHRAVMSFTFRFSSTQYSTFKTFIDLTRAREFWFVPDSSDMNAKFNVRRMPGMMPKASAPAVYSGTLEQRFEWTLQVIELVEDQEGED